MPQNHFAIRIFIIIGLATSLLAAACGKDDAGEDTARPDAAMEVDRSDEFFGQELVDIKLTLPADEWESLRTQYRSRVNLLGGEMCSATPAETVFTYSHASIDIDGQHYDNIGIRKKGFGSQSTTKPSLKIRLAIYEPGQKHLSLKRFVINNNRSDNTNLRQCFSYRLMKKAGLPTPRCTFAKVQVNGQALGVFTVVEEVKKPFLQRHFGNNTGNLYEGESNDFRPAFIGFDQDSNQENDTSRSDLLNMQEQLADTTPQNAVEVISKLIDLDAFYSFWAAEVMIWHRDGYNGNLNNFFIYADPSNDNKFAFIPWGTDNVMRKEIRTAFPHSTLAFGIISNLLYRSDEGRTRYYQELDRLMAEVWQEDEIFAWMDEKTALLEPHLRPIDTPLFHPQLKLLRTAVTERRAVFTESRSDGEPDWNAGMRGEICRIEVGTISGTVNALWDSYNDRDYSNGSASFTIDIDGQSPPVAIASGALSGLHSRGFDYIGAYILTADQQFYFFQFWTPVPRFFDPVQEGVSTPLTSPSFYTGGYRQNRAATPATIIKRFEVDEGSIEFTSLNKTAEGQISFTFSAKLYEH